MKPQGFWIIKRRSDGAVMPGHADRHPSRAEPGPGEWPRVFASKQSAASALGHWCKGVYSKNSQDWETGEITWNIIPVPGRDRGDFELVEMTLVDAVGWKDLVDVAEVVLELVEARSPIGPREYFRLGHALQKVKGNSQ